MSAAQEQQNTLASITLSKQVLEEMRQMAKDRKAGIPSPRGPAEFDFEQQTGSSAALVGSDDEVRTAELSDDDINTMTIAMLTDILSSAITMMEHGFRLTFQPFDVAKAKELFAANDEDADEDWTAEDDVVEEIDEAECRRRVEEANNRGANQDFMVEDDGLGYYVDGGEEDDDLVYDGSDNEDEAGDNDDDDVYFDEEKYILKNAYTPIFDAAYPPVGEIVQLSDEQFKTEVLQPFVIKKFNFVPYFADGVDGMIKRAMYAFVVGTLCAN